MAYRILGLCVLTAMLLPGGSVRARPVESCAMMSDSAGRLTVMKSPGCVPPKPLPRPMLDSTCKLAGAPVSPARNASGLLFDVSCKTAYVLPPLTANVQVAQLTPSTHVAHCPAVLALHTQIDDVLDQLGDLDARIADYLANFDRLQAEVLVLQEQLDGAMRVRDAADEALVAAANLRAQYAADASSTASDHEICVLLASEAECTAEQLAADTARATFDAFLTATYLPAQIAADDAARDYHDLFDAFSSKLDELTSGIEPVIELAAQLEAARESVQATYAHYAALEGARGTLTYSLPWDTLLLDYASANPGASWSYRTIPISAAALAATAIISGDPTTIPALLWAKLPAAGDAAASGEQVMRRGGSVSAEIGLSLVGACPYFPDGTETASVTLDRRSLAAYVTANAVYNYQVYARPAYVKLLNGSALVAKVKQHSAKFDPLAPTQLAGVVRSTVAVQAFAVDARAASDRHITVQAQVTALNLAATPSAKLSMSAAAELTKHSASVRTLSTKMALRPLPDEMIAVRPLPIRPIKPAPVETPIRPIPPPVKPQPTYQVIEQSGALTFVP